MQAPPPNKTTDDSRNAFLERFKTTQRITNHPGSVIDDCVRSRQRLNNSIILKKKDSVRAPRERLLLFFQGGLSSERLLCAHCALLLDAGLQGHVQLIADTLDACLLNLNNLEKKVMSTFIFIRGAMMMGGRGGRPTSVSTLGPGYLFE